MTLFIVAATRDSYNNRDTQMLDGGSESALPKLISLGIGAAVHYGSPGRPRAHAA